MAGALHFTHQSAAGIYYDAAKVAKNISSLTRHKLDGTLNQYLNYAEDFGGPTGCRHCLVHGAVFEKDLISTNQSILLLKRSSETAEYPSKFEMPGSYLFSEEESNYVGLKEGLKADAGLHLKGYSDVIDFLGQFRTNAPQPATNSDKPVDDPSMRTEHFVFAVNPKQKEKVKLGTKHVTYTWAQEDELERLPMTDEMRKAAKEALAWAKEAGNKLP